MNDLIKKIQQYYKVCLTFTRECTKYRIDIYAACSAFYIFLSFTPFLVIIIALIPYLPFSQGDIEKVILDVLPDNYWNIVHYIISELYANSARAISLSAIAVVWASAKGILGITKGLNEINHVNEYRNAILIRIRCMYYTLYLVVGIILFMIICVFGTDIFRVIEHYLIIPDFVYTIFAFKNYAMLILVVLLFLFLFVVLPAKKIRIRDQFFGAFIAGLVWWVFTRVFSLYLSYRNSYSIYGNFAIIIILGLWLYFGMYIMFMGAVLNQFLVSKKGNKHEG